MAEDFSIHLETVARQLGEFAKDEAIAYCLALLEEGTLTVPQLYEQVLAPALNKIAIPRAQEDNLIWREHAMTAIVRSIIERARPYVIKEPGSVKNGAGRVLLVCPEDEYHELGIRMGEDFFTIAGFETYFIGGNTPQETIVSAVETLLPDIVDIGVSNFLNLAQLKKIVAQLRQRIDARVKIAVSGSALGRSGKTAADFGADIIINSFADILALGEARQ